jgi:hypothetical protein
VQAAAVLGRAMKGTAMVATIFVRAISRSCRQFGPSNRRAPRRAHPLAVESPNRHCWQQVCVPIASLPFRVPGFAIGSCPGLPWPPQPTRAPGASGSRCVRMARLWCWAQPACRMTSAMTGGRQEPPVPRKHHSHGGGGRGIGAHPSLVSSWQITRGQYARERSRGRSDDARRDSGSTASTALASSSRSPCSAMARPLEMPGSKPAPEPYTPGWRIAVASPLPQMTRISC